MTLFLMAKNPFLLLTGGNKSDNYLNYMKSGLIGSLIITALRPNEQGGLT